jgi:hypothetical protein
MSTPSPQPLDYDLVSPYAPKHAREQTNPGPLSADGDPALPNRPRPAAIESEHDAKILDEIEISLRAMIAAQHDHPAQQPDEPAEKTSPEPAAQELPAEAAPDPSAKLSQTEPENPPDVLPTRTIDTLEAPSLAENRHSPEHRYYEAMRVQQVLQQVAQQVAQHSARETARAEPGPFVEEHRAMPAFLAPSMEPIQFDEPWPKARPRRRSGSANLLLRFGFAASGAAAVALFALPDMRQRLVDGISGPLAGLTSNASAVFSEGRPVLARDEPIAPIAVRTEPVVVAKEQDSFGAPMQKLATAGLAPALPDPRSAARSDNPPPARAPEALQKRETVMVPIAPPAAEAPNRAQPVIWHGPAGRATANESPTNGVAARPLAAEEIELLRKQGNDFIAVGDFAGARGVLERAADAGDAASALALAATYDPAVLARHKVKGLVPDNAKAAHWYERARDLGSQEAPLRLNALARGN